MVVRMMNPLQVEIAKTVFAHLPAVGNIGLISREELATMLHTACTDAALAGWARGTEITKKRLDQEMEILRQELKALQTELVWEQTK
jgi:hypothetical protein